MRWADCTIWNPIRKRRFLRARNWYGVGAGENSKFLAQPRRCHKTSPWQWRGGVSFMMSWSWPGLSCWVFMPFWERANSFRSDLAILCSAQSMDWFQLPSSKSDVRNNVRESVSIHDVSTLETVKAMVELQTACQLVTLPCWTRSGSAFRSLFRRILLELEVEDLNFRPCSLRQGGATYEMQSHGLNGGMSYGKLTVCELELGWSFSCDPWWAKWDGLWHWVYHITNW